MPSCESFVPLRLHVKRSAQTVDALLSRKPERVAPHRKDIRARVQVVEIGARHLFRGQVAFAEEFADHKRRAYTLHNGSGISRIRLKRR